MCGIICYLGSRPAQPILVDGLRRLEYRGYDSAGLAVQGEGGIECVRAKGKIRNLEEALQGQSLPGHCGIAHTRWATHGKPSVRNAHPHSDDKQQFFVIHNGIIENFAELKTELVRRGHEFDSDTDTEVLAHLVAELFQGDLESAVVAALKRVHGTFGIAVISTVESEKIVVARRGSPIILGIGEDEFFAASDVTALVSHTKKVVYLQDDDIAVLTPAGYRISNLEDESITRASEVVDWDIQSAEKQGYPHFMLKEIFEQPEAIKNALRGRTIESEGTVKLGGLELVQPELRRLERLIIVSCGTSYYAGLLGRCILETLTDFPVEVELASEFRYRRLNLRKNTAVLAISQSGETADTLAAVREAERKGALTLGLVNVVGSTIARETRAGVYNHAGPEIGVASTKSFTSQVTILYLLALYLGRSQQFSIGEGQLFLRELFALPEKVSQILKSAARIEEVAREFAHHQNFLFIGRKFNYPIALEGALKLKEVSYLHAEGYAAGEMKHGPIALIDSNFPTICVAPRDRRSDLAYQKMVSNIEEIRARGGRVLSIHTEGDARLAEMSDAAIPIPSASEWFSPFLTVVPLQLLAYYIARERGCEIDQPRNLAKSVTVE